MAPWFAELTLLCLGGLILAVVLELRRSRRENRLWREALRRLQKLHAA